MNSKFLIIAIYALTLTLVFQYFFPQDKTQTTTTGSDITLNIKDDTITIPNLPHIEIMNHTATGFSLLPCDMVRLSVDSRPISDIASVVPTFCTPIEIPAGKSTLIPFGPLAKILASTPGKYLISVNTPVGERMTTLTLSSPGTVRSLLTSAVYNPIYNLFVALLTFLPGHSLGWAIVIITLIIRLILLVPQHHMLQSQKKLQVIQPKIKELQTKYKDDQAKLGMEMIELYKKEGVNPMGSCLPLLIQMPILIGLYWVISGISDPANFYHLYSFFADFDPTKVSSYFYGLHLEKIGGTIGLIFAIVLGGIQYIQAKLSFAYNPTPAKDEKKIEKKEGEAPEMALDPAMMQKMMLYIFPVMIAVSSYFFPLGVGLYWFIGTLFVIGQQWYVNRLKPAKKSGDYEIVKKDK